ncbi:MAG: CBS domain-containing protein [Bdellovibrionales bacterium]|nr:CBS domain-containing protein [Bdellovibrionales bacterium]
MTKRAWEEMSPDLITIGWNEPVERAFHRMRAKRIRHLPVLDEAGAIVGILSDRDVQRAMISSIERPSSQPLGDETIEFDPESRVRDYMTWPAKSVDRNCDLKEVTERMIAEKVSSFLITRGEATLGILTAEDLLKLLARLLADPKTPKNWTLAGLLDETSAELERTVI